MNRTIAAGDERGYGITSAENAAGRLQRILRQAEHDSLQVYIQGKPRSVA